MKFAALALLAGMTAAKQPNIQCMYAESTNREIRHRPQWANNLDARGDWNCAVTWNGGATDGSEVHALSITVNDEGLYTWDWEHGTYTRELHEVADGHFNMMYYDEGTQPVVAVHSDHLTYMNVGEDENVYQMMCSRA